MVGCLINEKIGESHTMEGSSVSSIPRVALAFQQISCSYEPKYMIS